MKYRLLLLVLFAGLISYAATPAPEMKEATPSPMSRDPSTYSVALRVRRVTYEDAYVAVPVTDAIMKMKEDGTPGIDFEKLVAEAIRISKDPRVEWQVEESKTEPHQIQQSPPEGRKSFDAFNNETNEQKKG